MAIYNRAYKVATTLPKGSSLPPWVGLSLSTMPLLVTAVTAVYPSHNYSGFPPTIFDRWFNVLAPLQGYLPTATEALTDVPVTLHLTVRSVARRRCFLVSTKNILRKVSGRSGWSTGLPSPGS